MASLRASMMFTVAFIIGVTTLFFAAALEYLGVATPILVLALALGFNLAQWLVSPYIVQALYGVRELKYSEAPRLHQILESLSARAGIPKPKLMVAEVEYPNAFAYGSPLAGRRVAVTRGLLNVLEPEEVEAVLGHELGHLAHRDVEVMTFASALPAVFYILGQSLFGLGGDDSDRGAGILIGLASMLLYYILTLAVLHLSRIREYYADRFSVKLAPTPSIGARRLMSALAKIVASTASLKASGARLRVMGFKELFIVDPDTSLRDARELEGYLAAKKIMERRLTTADRLMELFSTHPHIVKRLRALEAIAEGVETP